MNMNKYEERAKDRAVELSKLFYPEHYRIDDNDPEMLADLIATFIPLARLCVQREAEAYIECFHYGMSEDTRIILNNALQSRLLDGGLIPPQTQTT